MSINKQTAKDKQTIEQEANIPNGLFLLGKQIVKNCRMIILGKTEQNSLLSKQNNFTATYLFSKCFNFKKDFKHTCKAKVRQNYW